jgi:hypothetical protein
VFDSDDLLWVTGLSLARAADLNINNDDLHINTRSKLNNDYYRDTLREIYKAYAFLDPSDESIPRNVLREFFKFGFRQPTINGYWCKLHDMLSVPVKNQYQIKLRHIYDLKKFRQELHGIADWLELPCAADQFLEPLHTKFISHLGDTNPNSLCDRIVSCVIAKTNTSIPKLSLLQESYVNARLESIFQKEMPFHEVDYFTNTKDIIQYIEHQAPDL